MIKFERFVVNHFQENTYVVYDDTSKEMIMLDPGLPDKRIDKFITEQGLKCTALVCTHCHPDHVAGVNYYKKLLKTNFLTHENEEVILENYSQWAQAIGFEPDAPKADGYIKAGAEIGLGKESLKVIETPGHSPGGICFHCLSEKILFSGDTLFQRSIGRSDFPGSNPQMLLDSIRGQLFTLDGATQVMPGHGEYTSIQEEIDENPFV
jgi:glyoxylase-like metal-dependent hydrolase (beta-lactamase superfamily II)